MIAASEHILYLLRHLGPHRDQDLRDSLALDAPALRRALKSLKDQHRIERQQDGRWRIIPTKPTPFPKGTR